MHEFIYVHVVCVLNCDCFVCVCVREVRETARPEERNPHPHPTSTPPLVVLARGWIPADVKQSSNGLSWRPRPTSNPLVSRCFLSPPSDLHPSSSSLRPPIHHSHAFFLGGKLENDWSDSRANSLGRLKVQGERRLTDESSKQMFLGPINWPTSSVGIWESTKNWDSTISKLLLWWHLCL